MVNLRKDAYGPAATKAVNLVAIYYHSTGASYDERSGKLSAVYLDNRLHPEDRRSAGQTVLALVFDKVNSSRRLNTKAQFSPSQAKKIKEAAGENTSSVLSKRGEAIGIAFGYQADLFYSKQAKGWVPIPETIRPSGLSVHAKGKETIVDRIFAKQAANKAIIKARRKQDTPVQDRARQQSKAPTNEPQIG